MYDKHRQFIASQNPLIGIVILVCLLNLTVIEVYDKFFYFCKFF